LQILYTRVIQRGDDKILKSYAFNEQPNKYFYSASTVKLPVAVLALEKLNDINNEGLNKFTHFSIDSMFEGLVSFLNEIKTECGYSNIADHINIVFIVSDNDAFNRLYDFLGQKEINERLRKRGLNNTKIIHRLSVASNNKQNMETNPINFYDEAGKIIYTETAKIESSEVNLNLTCTLKDIPMLTSTTLRHNQMFRTKLKYIHINPGKAGIVHIETDYKYSSARNYLLEDHSVIFIEIT